MTTVEAPERVAPLVEIDTRVRSTNRDTGCRGLGVAWDIDSGRIDICSAPT
jgi:hypothetical protein